MKKMSSSNKYQVWYKDTDPDTGAISRCELMAIATNKVMAECIKESLYISNADWGDPNKDFYIVIDDSNG